MHHLVTCLLLLHYYFYRNRCRTSSQHGSTGLAINHLPLTLPIPPTVPIARLPKPSSYRTSTVSSPPCSTELAINHLSLSLSAAVPQLPYPPPPSTVPRQSPFGLDGWGDAEGRDGAGHLRDRVRRGTAREVDKADVRIRGRELQASSLCPS